MRQIILDTETTGIDPKEGHRVIEIGCVEMKNRRLTGNTLHLYINPEREVEKEAIQIHGITNEFLKDKPIFNDVAKELCDFIQDAEIIAHNAKFDINFLNYELKNYASPLGQISDYATNVFDTLTLARDKYPGQRNSLDALAKRLSITHFNRDLHGALLDAEILAQVYLGLTSGQSQLFDDETNSTHSTGSTKIRRIKNKKPLKIILANHEELQSHDAFLALL